MCKATQFSCLPSKNFEARSNISSVEGWNSAVAHLILVVIDDSLSSINAVSIEVVLIEMLSDFKNW